MASLSMSGRGNVDQVAGMLEGEIQNSGFSCTLVDRVQRNVGSVKVIVMVFEKYFMRAANRASLTVMVSGEDETVCVDAIGSGGGQGAIFKFSWGAEESFVGTVEKILARYGFM